MKPLRPMRREARDLLKSARDEERPLGQARKNALRGRVLTHAAGIAVTTTAATAGAEAASGLASAGSVAKGASWLALPLTKLGGAKTVAILVVTAAAGGGAVLASRSDVRPAVVEVVPSGAIDADEAEHRRAMDEAPRPNLSSLTFTTPAPTAEPVRAATSADRSNLVPPAPSVSTLAEETKLVGDAQRALSGGRPAEALTLLDEHRARYPKGELTPERNVARVLALCGMGKVEEGRAAARTLAREGSALADRFRAVCGE